MSGRPSDDIHDYRVHATKTRRCLRAMGGAVRGSPHDKVRKRCLDLCRFMLKTDSTLKARLAKKELVLLLPSCVGLNRPGLRFRSVLESQ